jgi:uncharacterized protein
MSREVRSVVGIEIREADSENGKKPKISGYAAKFDTPTVIGGAFIEKIAKGAFSESINSDTDVRALFNHDSNFVLGRQSNGTLTLREDDEGLFFEVSPPDTGWADDLVKSIKRGDISQMSFGFMIESQTWEDGEDLDIRTLNKVSLIEVSPVTFPAYPDTSASVRSMQEWRAARKPAELVNDDSWANRVRRMKLALLERA